MKLMSITYLHRTTVFLNVDGAVFSLPLEPVFFPLLSPPTFGKVASTTLFGQVQSYRFCLVSNFGFYPFLQNGEGYEPMAYESPALNAYQTLMRSKSNTLYDHVTRKLNTKQYTRIASLRTGPRPKKFAQGNSSKIWI